MTNTEYIDLKNHIQQVEDKQDAGLRLLARIARRLATRDDDEQQTAELTRELAEAAGSLEATVAAAKRPA